MVAESAVAADFVTFLGATFFYNFLVGRYGACSYDVRLPSSNASYLLLRQPVENISPNSCRTMDVSFQTRCDEQSSPTIVQQSTFDLEQLRVLEEFGNSPHAADVNTNTPRYKPETDAAPGSIDSGYSSQIEFPDKFVDSTDRFYHAPGSTTNATSLRGNLCKSYVYQDDIIHELENSYYYSPSTWSRGNAVCTHTSNRSHEEGFQFSPLHVSRGVFDKDGSMTPLQERDSLEFCESLTLPLHATSTIRTSDSSTTTSLSQQSYVSDVLGQRNELTSFLTMSEMQPVSNYQQQNDIMPEQPRTLINDSEDHATSRTHCRPEFSEEFTSTSLLKARSPSSPKNYSTKTPDLSEFTHTSPSSEHPPSLVICSPSDAVSTGAIENVQISCRRRLFSDEISYQEDFEHTVRRKWHQDQGGFHRSRPQTSCEVLENEHHPNKPFPAISQPNFSRNSVPTISEISTGCERSSSMTPDVRCNHEDSLSVANPTPYPVFSTGEVGKTQTWRPHWLFDETGHYEADEWYRVRKNSQQQQESFQNSSLSVAFNEDAATAPFRLLKCLDFSDTSAAFSTASQTSCRRRLFDETGCYRVRKKSAGAAAVHRCQFCDRVYTRASTLRDHIRSRHSTAPKPHVCSICGRRFMQMSNLDAHRRTHTGL